MMQLNLRRKRKRRLPVRTKESLQQPTGINHTWSMDIMSDSLIYGRHFRVLNIIDDYNREALAIEPAFSLPAERVIQTLEEVIFWRGKPMEISVDNGPEFISNDILHWAEENEIRIKHTQPGKPTQNVYIERFQGTFRRGVLDVCLFGSQYHAREIASDWVDGSNQSRPQNALNCLSPVLYTQKQAKSLCKIEPSHFPFRTPKSLRERILKGICSVWQIKFRRKKYSLRLP